MLLFVTGEREYPCSYQNCNKTFKDQTLQERHERLKHKGKRLKCTLCASTFSQQGHLKKHIKKSHPTHFHECIVCGSYFNSKEELEQHLEASDHKEHKKSGHEQLQKKKGKKVDKKDKAESMRIAAEAGQPAMYGCTECGKLFEDYSNMCRHRKLSHQRSQIIPKRAKLLTPKKQPDKASVPQQVSIEEEYSDFLNNAAEIVADNLANHLDGTETLIEKTAKKHISWPVGKNSLECKVENGKKLQTNWWSKLNFPHGFKPRPPGQALQVIEPEQALCLTTTDKDADEQRPRTRNRNRASSKQEKQDVESTPSTSRAGKGNCPQQVNKKVNEAFIKSQCLPVRRLFPKGTVELRIPVTIQHRNPIPLDLSLRPSATSSSSASQAQPALDALDVALDLTTNSNNAKQESQKTMDDEMVAFLGLKRNNAQECKNSVDMSASSSTSASTSTSADDTAAASEEEDKYECLICYKKFKDSSVFDHVKKDHHPLVLDYNFVNSIPSSSELKNRAKSAPICTSDPSEKNKKYVCTACYKEFYSLDSLEEHQRERHPNVEFYHNHCAMDIKYNVQLWREPTRVGALNVISSQVPEKGRLTNTQHNLVFNTTLYLNIILYITNSHSQFTIIPICLILFHIILYPLNLSVKPTYLMNKRS